MPSPMKEVLSMLGAVVEVESEEEESLTAPINDELPAIEYTVDEFYRSIDNYHPCVPED